LTEQRNGKWISGREQKEVARNRNLQRREQNLVTGKSNAKNLDSHWHAATMTRRRVSTQQQLSEQENSDLNYEQFNQKRNNFFIEIQ
jgi:hypothetical protein